MKKKLLIFAVLGFYIVLFAGSFFISKGYFESKSSIAKVDVKNEKHGHILNNANKSKKNTIGGAIHYFSDDTKESILESRRNSINALRNANVKQDDYYKKLDDKPLSDKEVFLTFDDGPSEVNTPMILDTLKENKINATFFLVGNSVNTFPGLVKAELDGGNAVMPHSFTHKYSIYKSINSYMDDLDKCINAITNVTGTKDFKFLRFPGGSDNTVSNHNTMRDIRDAVANRGIYYVDWNVDSTDATAVTVPVSKLRSSLFTQLASKKFAVILMHDAPTKTTSAKVLPELIKYLKDNGFTFRTFKDITKEELQLMIKWRIINRGSDIQIKN